MQLRIVILAFMSLASCVEKEKKQVKNTIEVITYVYDEKDNKKTNYLEPSDSINLCKY
jgi:hypothetical protein